MIALALLLLITPLDKATAGWTGVERGHRLMLQAEAHSADMVRRQTIFHSTDLGYAQAEIVGQGPNVPTVLRAFLDSPEHAEILAMHWDRVGAGVRTKDGRVWITIQFKRK